MILSFTLRTLLWANPAGRAGAALLSASTAAVAGARPTGACPAAVRALSSSSSAWPAAPPSEAREGPPRAGSGAAASTSGAYGRPMRGYAAAAAAAAAQPAPDDLLAPGGDGAAGAARAPPPPPPPLTQLPDVPPGSRRTGLVGVKAGMTHEWDTATGARTALTVVWFDAPAVLQAKAAAGPDGYEALQVGAGAARRRRASLRGVGRPAGHAAAHGGSVEAPPRWVKEFRVTPDAALPPGTRLRADHFAVGQLVDVQGTTVGKGFTGVMKKWGFKGQGASHGNSKAHRKAGGIGACQDPGKVWPGKKMAGRSGAVRRTVLSLRVAGVDADRGLVYLAGAVPGGAGSPVRVSDAVLARHGGRQPVARPFPTQL